MQDAGSLSEITLIRLPQAIKSNMTAIAIRHVNDGFVIAADGRRRAKGRNGQVLKAKAKDNAIKIFEIKTPQIRGAYAVAGSVGEKNFDIPRDCKELSSFLSQQSFDNYGGYVSVFMTSIAAIIASNKYAPRVTARAEGGWKIIDLFFVGYFTDQPFSHTVSVYHEGDKIKTSNRPLGETSLLYGSDRVAAMMYDLQNGGLVSDSPFIEYQYHFPPEPTLRDAREYTVRYIKACCSSIRPEIDRNIRELIGGTIRVARVTKDKGFEWEQSEEGDSAAAESP